MITVTPKKGKALLWPSTLNADPEEIEARTMHEARPVIKGLKYAGELTSMLDVISSLYGPFIAALCSKISSK